MDLSTGFRAPNIDDLGKVFIKDQFLTIPNSQLVPEYAYNFSLGVGKKNQILTTFNLVFLPLLFNNFR